MNKRLLAAIPALLLIAPLSSMALGSATPLAYTDVHWIAGAGGTYPAPSTCGSITHLRLDLTFNGNSANFGANGNGTCTTAGVANIFTGSGIEFTNGMATFNLYNRESQTQCSISLSSLGGNCTIYLLSDPSEVVGTFTITFTTLP
jgi:hypothetical protein